MVETSIRRRHRDERRAATTSSNVISTKNIQPIGDWLKACTLLKMPLRVRNVAKLHRPKVAIARARAVLFQPSRCRQTMSEWMKTVPVSHGISEPFSTGSQPQ